MMPHAHIKPGSNYGWPLVEGAHVTLPDCKKGACIPSRCSITRRPSETCSS